LGEIFKFREGTALHFEKKCARRYRFWRKLGWEKVKKIQFGGIWEQLKNKIFRNNEDWMNPEIFKENASSKGYI